MSGKDETVPANLERGRYTLMLPGETVIEANERLLRGEPGAEVNLPPAMRKLLDEVNLDPRSRHFKPGGKR